jgi:inorganic pyrophosphatase
VVEIKILGSINFIDSGENDLKIIAINLKDTTFKNINSLEDIELQYPGIVEIIKIWFTNYKGKDKVFYEKTLDVESTVRIINKSNKSFLFYKNNTSEN